MLRLRVARSSALLLIASLATAGAAGAASEHADPHGCPGGCPNITFGAGAMQLSRAAMPHGAMVFTIHAGSAARRFVVLQTSLSSAALPMTGSVVNLRKAGHVLGTRNVAAGHVGRLTLTLAAGTYVLLSNAPGDYNAGYHAVFRVT